ncbi:histidinol-phosphate transaminase [Paenibacillus sp. 598K]|nr:histidinol-phosphate transaminase [Paenibacillus sp. 598K]
MMSMEKKPLARKTIQNINPYIPGKPIWELQEELGLSEVIKLASNENPLGASPRVRDAITASVANIHRYPDAGTWALRQKLAAQLATTPEQLIVTNGGDELITLVAETFLEPGDEMIIVSPSFSEYEFGAHLMGAQVITVPLDNQFRFNPATILGAVTAHTKILCLCSPNNPTGTYLPKSDLQYIMDRLPKHVIVLFDAAYSHYATAADYTNGLEFIREGYPLIVLQTFSKIYGLAGLRIGYGVASEELIRSLLKVKEPFSVNALAQVAACAALEDQEHFQLSLQVNSQGRDQLCHAFEELGLSFIKTMSNFVLVELGSQAKDIYEQLMKQGIIVRYGGTWNLPHHVRISVGTKAENARLIDHLTNLSRPRA